MSIGEIAIRSTYTSFDLISVSFFSAIANQVQSNERNKKKTNESWKCNALGYSRHVRFCCFDKGLLCESIHLLYIALIRSRMEYLSPVWSPGYRLQRKLITESKQTISSKLWEAKRVEFCTSILVRPFCASILVSYSRLAELRKPLTAIEVII